MLVTAQIVDRLSRADFAATALQYSCHDVNSRAFGSSNSGPFKLPGSLIKGLP